MLQKKGPNVVYLKDEIQDEREIRTDNFYKSNRGYIPPLERKNLKRKFENGSSSQNESFTEKEMPQVKPAKKQKTHRNSRAAKQKAKKTRTQKIASDVSSGRHDLHNSAADLNVQIKKPVMPKPHSLTVPLSSVLAKNGVEREPQKRKFFKSRSSDILLKLSSIIPVNNKSAAITKPGTKICAIKAVSSQENCDKENSNIEKVDESPENAVSQPGINKTQKWIQNSFSIDGVDNVSEKSVSVEQEETKNRPSMAKPVVNAEENKITRDSVEPSLSLLTTDGGRNSLDLAVSGKTHKLLKNSNSMSALHDTTGEIQMCLPENVKGDRHHEKYVQEVSAADEKDTSAEARCRKTGENEEPNDGCQTEENERAGDESEFENSSSSFIEDYCSDSGDSTEMYPVFQRYVAGGKIKEDVPSSPNVGSHCQLNEQNKSHLKTMLPKGKEQFTLDAGQKMDPVQCDVCNMMYQVGVEHDERLHIKFHKKYMERLKFQGWKKEHVIGNFYDGRVIMVTKDDPHFMLKKVDEVLEIVNRELGFVDQNLSIRPNATFLLYVHVDKQIVGCLVAESITKAYQIKEGSDHLDSANKIERDSGTVWADSKSVKALCGINRLWVASSYRRQGIASRMTDCLRCNFLYGHAIKFDELAFLDPSKSGQLFAMAYAKTNCFLVYK